MTGGNLSREQAVRQMREACKLLTAPSPENLTSCLELLEGVAGSLCPSDGVQGDRDALREAIGLRSLVQRAGVLLEGAAGYHRRWGALVGSLTAGYAAGGQPGAYVPAGTVCLRG